ncbi:uncharacterized protein LOC123722714 [Papilio machaon]|uniref:uncharacterized protein LOC123722714 n=1 Tax=Papilio machaon TaxID=76193 RepID=UPI001E6632BD|nr:uncharacterized protein LOC123722714 [Papilio machaon]
MNIRKKAEQVNTGSYADPCYRAFTEGELKWSASSLNPKKAPGIDGLNADICRAAIVLNPGIYLALANKCLELAHFPAIWKEAVVVILRKPGKADYTHPKSLRPIGLLPILGKILEKMLVARIHWHILPQISPRQYGFMPQRSTEDALYDMMRHIHDGLSNRKLMVLVSLDIEGAFNNAWWPAIKCGLVETKCPVYLRRIIDSYLSDRKVRVRYAGAEYTRTTNKGCVQGSIRGPTLWNVLLNPLLKDLEKEGNYCHAFADDVVLIFSGDSAYDVEQRAAVTLARVHEWGVGNKLNFAPQKTQAMLITRKLKYDTPGLRMGGVDIVDDRLTFGAHVDNVCRKAQSLYVRLQSAAKLQWGLNPEVVRRIYTAVVEPVIMYAASAWSPAARKKSVRQRLSTVQRGFVQKIIKGYRTVSLHSALLLAGVLPLDLRIQEAASLYENKKGHSTQVAGDREVEGRSPCTSLAHPADRPELDFVCLEDGAEIPAEIEIKIFTDGSKIGGRLKPHCRYGTAELLAIKEASNWARKAPARIHGIFSDSRSALQTIANPNSGHPLAEETRENLKEMRKEGGDLKFYWVRAHIGTTGNERADTLAKKAALKVKRRPDYAKCPVSFVKRQIRQEPVDEWNQRYQEGETARVTKVLFPNVSSAHGIIKSIQMDYLTVQVLTGHGGFSEYLYRFKCKENPSCACDDMTNKEILHLVTDCPIFTRERYEIERPNHHFCKFSHYLHSYSNPLSPKPEARAQPHRHMSCCQADSPQFSPGAMLYAQATLQNVYFPSRFLRSAAQLDAKVRDRNYMLPCVRANQMTVNEHPGVELLSCQCKKY